MLTLVILSFAFVLLLVLGAVLVILGLRRERKGFPGKAVYLKGVALILCAGSVWVLQTLSCTGFAYVPLGSFTVFEEDAAPCVRVMLSDPEGRPVPGCADLVRADSGEKLVRFERRFEDLSSSEQLLERLSIRFSGVSLLKLRGGYVMRLDAADIGRQTRLVPAEDPAPCRGASACLRLLSRALN